MFRQLKKNLVATLVVAMTIGQVAPTFADSADTSPDMGTSVGNTLSIGREMQIGGYYVRQLRDSAPLVSNPLLTQCINSSGMYLVSYANPVKAPFCFFLINNDETNAFAFSSGNVVLHSALSCYSDNENQLASAMVHEISRVTQRHLVQAMEDQQCSAPLTWVGALGSILLAMASLQARMAALTDTLARMCQGMISFTQQNEREVDCIDIRALQRSGLDPQTTPTFLEKLLDQARYSSCPPEILLTRPLPEGRLTDARNRTSQMHLIVVQSSEDFYLTKVRTLGMYSSGRNQLTSDLLDEWVRGNVRQQRAVQCGRTLRTMEVNKHDEARKTLQLLLATEPGDAWYLDLVTDIDLEQSRANDVISCLKNARDSYTDPALQLNLANAYLWGGQPQEATNILNRYAFNNKDDSNGWDLLTQAETTLNNRNQELAARVEGYTLAGRLDQVISLLSSASSQVKLGSPQQARYDARIDQLCQLQERFKPYTKIQFALKEEQ